MNFTCGDWVKSRAAWHLLSCLMHSEGGPGDQHGWYSVFLCNEATAPKIEMSCLLCCFACHQNSAAATMSRQVFQQLLLPKSLKWNNAWNLTPYCIHDINIFIMIFFTPTQRNSGFMQLCCYFQGFGHPHWFWWHCAYQVSFGNLTSLLYQRQQCFIHTNIHVSFSAPSSKTH